MNTEYTEKVLPVNILHVIIWSHTHTPAPGNDVLFPGLPQTIFSGQDECILKEVQYCDRQFYISM